MKSGEVSDESKISQLRNFNINQFNFLNNIKLLTGSSHLNESRMKLSEMQLAKIFLEKFEKFKKIIFIILIFF